MSEASRRQAIREALTRAGYLVIAYPAGAFGRKGTADFLVCARGCFVAVEVKDDKGRPTSSQRAFGEAVERAGGTYFIARTIEDALLGCGAAILRMEVRRGD